jgi:hypothetical protein
MFSFNLSDKGYFSPHKYTEKNEDEEEEDDESNLKMDTSNDTLGNAPFEQFVFVPSELALQGPISFKREYIPPTLLPVPPNVLSGLETIDDLSQLQKCVLSIYAALPIPVHLSPVMILLMDNVPKGSKQPQKQRYISWMQSAYQLRSIMFLVQKKVLPFHKSLTPEYIDECMDEFLEQTSSYENMHFNRVEELYTYPFSPAILEKFVEYCEDFSYYYIHSIERYLYKTLIEPHGSAHLCLENLLTPRANKPTLNQCEHPQFIQKYVYDFFELKVLATHKYDQRHAGDDYVKRNPFQLDTLRQRITNNTGQHFRGCIDVQTLQEYFNFLNPNINVK